MLYLLGKAELTANAATLESWQTAAAVGGVGACRVACRFVAADCARAGLSIWTTAYISNGTALYFDTCTASPTAHIRRAN
jgi:hypothetical protein